MTGLKSSVAMDVGTILDGRYRLAEVIGEGGMARVFRAEDAALTRTVAIKVMHAPTDGSLVRVQSETALLASLSHPSLVTLYDAHISEDEPSYLVMEYVDGPTLSARLAAGPLPPRDVAALALDLAEALHMVHEKGVVHRDIKPSNVLLWNSPLPDRAFRAKLADFGIARLLDSTRVTTPGTVMGTAAYLAPEQVRGEQPSTAADIYSLGLMLIEALSGKRAFGAALNHESLIARLTVSPTIPDDISGAWRTLLTAMTASNPARRPTAFQVALAATILRGEDAAAGDVLAVLDEPTVAARDIDLLDPFLATMAAAALSATQSRQALPGAAESVAETAPERAPGLGPESGPSAHSDPTKVLTPAAESAQEEPTDPRKARGLLMAVVALIVAGALAVGVLVATSRENDAGSRPPTLPAVEEPLGGHLDDLLESVTPVIPHRFAAALAGIALIAGLSGCATPALDQAAATQFQESVVAIADSAAAGDLTGAVAGLDELQTELNAAIDADLVTAARAVRIQTAIDVVRSDLEVLQAAPAPVESPAPVEATDTGEVPAGTGGGENDNSGPGNNNGNGNNSGGNGNDSGPGNGNGNGNGNGKKSR